MYFITLISDRSVAAFSGYWATFVEVMGFVLFEMLMFLLFYGQLEERVYLTDEHVY